MFFPGFLDEARCKRVVELAAARLAPSSLALRAGDTAQNTADIRTSQGTFLTRADDNQGVLDYLEKRIADVTMLPQRHGEPFNVLRYEVGQKYDSHYDTFDPESYGPQSRRALLSAARAHACGVAFAAALLCLLCLTARALLAGAASAWCRSWCT